jgi:hypothetical protein
MDVEPNWGPVVAPSRIKTYTGGVVSRTRAYGLLKDGKIEAVKLGKRTGFVRASIDAYLAALPRAA